MALLLRALLPRDLPEILLLATNLVPLLGAMLFGWKVLAILYFYLGEMAIVGVLTWLKLVVVNVAGPEHKSIPDKVVAVLFDVAILGFVFGLALLVLYALINHVCLPRAESWKGGRYREFLRTDGWTLVSVVISHGMSLWSNFVRRREYLEIRHIEFFVRILHRLIPTFLLPLALGVLIQKVGVPDALIALAGVVAVKSGIDLWTHRRSHRRAAMSPQGG